MAISELGPHNPCVPKTHAEATSAAFGGGPVLLVSVLQMPLKVTRVASSDLSKAQLNGRSWERLLHFAWLYCYLTWSRAGLGLASSQVPPPGLLSLCVSLKELRKGP